MTAEIDGRELRFNDHKLNFEQRIVEAVEFDNKLVVLLNSDDFEDGDEMVGQNIVAVDEKGEIDWRIEYHGFKVRNRAGKKVPQAFFGLWIDEDDGSLRAGIPVADFVVDPETGMFLKVELTQK